jgi:hypothetical protein
MITKYGQGTIRTVNLPSSIGALPADVKLAQQSAGGDLLTLPGEVELLCWMASQTPGNILEIGCHTGLTTLALARTNPDKQIYAVDCLNNRSLQPAQQHEMPTYDSVFRHAIGQPNAKLVLGNSSEIDWLARFTDLGTIFIDGDHSKEGVGRDTAKALDYFQSSGRQGLVVWHDYYNKDSIPSWCGVNGMVDQLPLHKCRYSVLCFAWVGSHDTLSKWFGPLLSVCHASNRPGKWHDAYLEYVDKSDHVVDMEYILCVDQQGPFTTELLSNIPRHISRNLTINTGRKCAVDAWNQSASAARGNILITASDDMPPPVGWDTSLLSTVYDLDEDFVIQVSSGTPQDARDLMVMSVLSKARYNRLGWVFYPEYEGMFGDDDFTEHARADGVIVDAKHLVFAHHHPVFDSEVVWDETYERQNQSSRYQRGQDILSRRREDNFGVPRHRTMSPSNIQMTVPLPPGVANPQVLALCLPGELFSGRWLIHCLDLFSHLLTKYIVIPMNGYASNPSVTRHAMAMDVLNCQPLPDLILWMDDDNTITRAQFDTLAMDLDSYPQLDAVFGWCGVEQDQYTTPEDRRKPSCGLLNEDGDCCPFTWETMHNTKGLVKLGWSGFPAVLMRRRAIELAGPRPFNFIPDDKSRWGFRGEDVSFCQRAIAAGCTFVVDPRIKVPHLKLRDTSDSNEVIVPTVQSDIVDRSPSPVLSTTGNCGGNRVEVPTL